MKRRQVGYESYSEVRAFRPFFVANTATMEGVIVCPFLLTVKCSNIYHIHPPDKSMY